MDTHGVSGTLGSIIPPFTRNYITTSILQGTYDLTNIDPMPKSANFYKPWLSHQNSAAPIQSTIIKSRYSLSYSLNCLHAAHYSLDECHQIAAQLLHDHLTDRVRHAASTSNTSAETALNNILKAEVAIATFWVLKKCAKGETRASLQ